MPFNPTLPAPNSPIVSAELRDQFNGLKDLIDESIPATEKAAPNGVASLDAAGNLVQPANFATLANKPVPVADGTYTVGIGSVQNGTITVVGGIITAIQEASNSSPSAPLTVAGAGDPAFDGLYLYESGTGMGRVWRLDANHTLEAWAGEVWYLRDETNYPGLIPYQKDSNGGEPADDSWSALDGPPGNPTVT